MNSHLFDVSAQDKVLLRSKVLEIVALNDEKDAYDDEYDDSFDDFGPGTRTGHTECEGSTHLSPTPDGKCHDPADKCCYCF
jgi:hypothetical protein